MGLYLLRRLGWSVVVLFAIAVLTFFVTYILPADPARMIAGIRATPEDVERIRHALGLDQPFLVQLGDYLGRLLHGDFGHSYIQNRDVLGLILERFPATLQLAVAGLFVALAIGLPLGVFAATHKGTSPDRAVDDLHHDPGLGAVVPRRLSAAQFPRFPAADHRPCGDLPDRRLQAIRHPLPGAAGDHARLRVGRLLHATDQDGDDR